MHFPQKGLKALLERLTYLLSTIAKGIWIRVKQSNLNIIYNSIRSIGQPL